MLLFLLCVVGDDEGEDWGEEGTLSAASATSSMASTLRRVFHSFISDDDTSLSIKAHETDNWKE